MSVDCKPDAYPAGFVFGPIESGFVEASEEGRDFVREFFLPNGVSVVFDGSTFTRFVNGVETPNSTPQG